MPSPERPDDGRMPVTTIQRSGPSRERGAILVLTCISMIALMAFTAFAVDLGQRHQQLATAQHSIDASVLAAAQYLSAHDGDHAGANAKVKEVLRQNLGIDVGAWSNCHDADHLPATVAGDTDCISFERNVGSDGAVKYDIRVRLPGYSMDTIFGGALGVDRIDLAAAAASNGRSCVDAAVCDDGRGPATTVGATTTTFRHDPTYCEKFNAIQLALYDDVWVGCSWYFTSYDRTTWQRDVCTNELVSFTFGGKRQTWRVKDLDRFVFHWPVCRNHRAVADREAYLHQLCFASDLWEVYNWKDVYTLCKQRRPGLVDFDAYRATSTTRANTTVPPTTAPRSTVPGPTTPGQPPATVPTSLDLSG